MDYFANVVRATQSALRTAHTEFQREMYSATPSNQNTSNAPQAVPTLTSAQSAASSQPSSSATAAPITTNVPTITQTELNRIRGTLYDNSITLKSK